MKTIHKRKGSPIPTIFDTEEDMFISEICDRTGLSKADIIRRSCRFALAKFLSGQIPPSDPLLQHK